MMIDRNVEFGLQHLDDTIRYIDIFPYPLFMVQIKKQKQDHAFYILNFGVR